MKLRITFKELSLLIGIAVAIIIWITLRFGNFSFTFNESASFTLPAIDFLAPVIKKASTLLSILQMEI